MFLFRFEYHMFYVLYPYVTYLLTLLCTDGHQGPGEILVFSFVNHFCIYMSLLLGLRGSRWICRYSYGLEGRQGQHRVEAGSAAHPASYPGGTRDSFLGGKADGT
jgi:hypothetical protein